MQDSSNNQSYLPLIDFYSEHVKKFGNDVRSVVWGSRDSQVRRFQVFVEMAEMDGKSVLDVGCGLADFYDFLNMRGISSKYVGVDITEDMIAVCRKTHPSAEFHAGDIRTMPAKGLESDVVVASGIFNWKIADHERHMWQTIQTMYDLAKEVVLVNIMSTRAKIIYPDNYYADADEFMRRCLEITPHVALRDDYMEHDFTVALRKS